MNIRSLVVAAYLGATAALSGATLDDKIKSFEDAVKFAPEVKSDSTPGVWPRGRDLTIEDLELAVQRGGEANIEGVVSQLMATHPSDNVRDAGEAVLHELEAKRKERASEYEDNANSALAETPDALAQAKTAADLDGILKEFQALQNPQGTSSDPGVSPEIANKISTTFQYITQWQDYLAASSSGNWQEAQNALRVILNNRQIDAPIFFPRSQILARYEATFGNGAAVPNAKLGYTTTDPDPILAKIRKPEDVEKTMPDLEQVGPLPGYDPYDWSELIALAKARDNALAGLAFEVDLKKAMTWPDWGDQLSRITAMQLLFLLPYYFDTQTSDPPKKNEATTAYLDRLSATASAKGNLALLQRVVAVQVALGTAGQEGSAIGTQQFLAGLSQDAAGQYDPAVVSYENALKTPDRFLPVKIVGERLSAIKAANPDDFDKGMTTFLTPPLAASYGRPGMPPWMSPGMPPGVPGQLGNRFNQISVLPIPMTISVPSQGTPPPSSNTASPTPDTK